MSARRAAPTYAQAAASYSAIQRVEDVRIAARHLKEARNLLSHAPNARAAVARALKSVEGAERHAETAPYREQRGARRQAGARKPRPKLYLLTIVGDVEPSLAGPMTTEAERIAFARGHRAARGDRDGLYRLDVSPSGSASVDSFSGAELDRACELCTCGHARGAHAGALMAGRCRLTTTDQPGGDRECPCTRFTYAGERLP